MTAVLRAARALWWAGGTVCAITGPVLLVEWMTAQAHLGRAYRRVRQEGQR